MKVVYGTDGGINQIIMPEGKASKAVTRAGILRVGTTAAPGTYTWGAHNNKLVITETQVTGTGRGTVFKGLIGDHDNYLKAGDVATKGQYDNPNYNQVIGVRNLKNDIRKDMRKNDVGGLPDAIIDIYYWGDQYKNFGEYYSDYLSFPSMRYWYMKPTK